MSWLSLSPADGPAWTILNESAYTDDEVLPLLQFVAESTGGLTEGVTVKLRKPRGRSSETSDHYCGQAGSTKVGHARVGWQKTPLRMGLTLSPRDWAGYRRPARVCWHSTRLGELQRALWAARADDEERDSLALVYDHLAGLAAAGETHLGRWPIYHVADWREMLVHLAAHEVAHLIQYDRGRGSGGSEIFCEKFALQTLEAFRASRCGDEPDASAENGRRTPFRSPLLGLVTGPAPAAPTPNRKEPPTVATTTSPQKADPKDLFASLLDEATKVADKAAQVKKAAYVRVDVLLDDGKKHKTLAYVNNPTSKAVRVEVPKKNGGGYDVIRVEAKKDIDKALKAIRENHERILAATQTAAAA